MDDLAQWLRAQLDEDERIARAAGKYASQEWHLDEGFGETVLWWPPEFHTPYEEDKHWRGQALDSQLAPHIARHDPARVLREIDAKRLLLNRWSELQGRIEAEADEVKRGNLALTRHGLDMFVYQLGTVYADRPGYREEWRA